MEILKEFNNSISVLDLVYLIITILSLIKCYIKGFVLSVLAMAKWLLAYVLTLIIFPRIKPYVKDIIDNEYILDIALGISIFIIVIFFILLINKGISKAVKYTGLGNLDTIFGFFFGFVRSYIIAVCIFSAVHIVYNHDYKQYVLQKIYKQRLCKILRIQKKSRILCLNFQALYI